MAEDIARRLLSAVLEYLLAKDDLRELRSQKAEREDIQAAARELRRSPCSAPAEDGVSFAAMHRVFDAPVTPTQKLVLLAIAYRADDSGEGACTVLERDGHACRYCGRTDERLGLDHVLPRRLGGSHKPDNLVACCLDCNSKKGGRRPADAGMALRPAPGATP